MNKVFNYLAIAGALVIGLASCVKEAPQYEPAPAAGTAEVFFSPTLPSSVNLKGNTGKITVAVNRVQTASGLTVGLSSSAPAQFNVPSSVSFDAGASTANVDITFDPATLEEEVNYPIALTITDETSPYGSAEYSFVASIPASWIKFASGTLTEDWWGEVEPSKTLWYQEVGDHLLLCKIEGCFGHNTIEGGNPYDVQDYVFYWDTETNYLSIPMRYMGYTNTNGYKVYYGDAEAFFRDVYEYDDELMQRNGYADVADYAYNSQGYTRPYYDGNGGFYLAAWYFFSKEDKKGSGYSFGDSVDTFIADGFVRIVDYNGEKYFGASSALYEGIMTSSFFSNTQGDDSILFEQSMRYDASYLDKAEFDDDGNFDVKKNAGMTTTYYLTDYFMEGQCLAFEAPVPELLADGDAISDVKNYQTTGLQFMGHDIFVNVKKGSVSLAEGEEFPEFSIILNVFSMVENADGELEQDMSFGTVEEVFTALEYGQDNYTLDDIYGGYKEDYIGTWQMTAIDGSGEPYNYTMTIEDNGTDEDGNEWLKIRNLTGWSGAYGLEDDVDALYSGYVIYVYGGQVLETPFVMNDLVSSVQINLFDPDSGKSYASTKNAILGGICEDGNFAFVNQFSGVNICGFYYSLVDINMYLDVAYYIWGSPAAEGSVASSTKLFNTGKQTLAASNYVELPVNKPLAKRPVKAKASVSAPARVINMNNVVKPEKNLDIIVSGPMM